MKYHHNPRRNSFIQNHLQLNPWVQRQPAHRLAVSRYNYFELGTIAGSLYPDSCSMADFSPYPVHNSLERYVHHLRELREVGVEFCHVDALLFFVLHLLSQSGLEDSEAGMLLSSFSRHDFVRPVFSFIRLEQAEADLQSFTKAEELVLVSSSDSLESIPVNVSGIRESTGRRVSALIHTRQLNQVMDKDSRRCLQDLDHLYVTGMPLDCDQGIHLPCKASHYCHFPQFTEWQHYCRGRFAQSFDSHRLVLEKDTWKEERSGFIAEDGLHVEDYPLCLCPNLFQQFVEGFILTGQEQDFLHMHFSKLVPFWTYSRVFSHRIPVHPSHSAHPFLLLNCDNYLDPHSYLKSFLGDDMMNGINPFSASTVREYLDNLVQLKQQLPTLELDFEDSRFLEQMTC